MCENSDLSGKYGDKFDVVDSKIRKFFFKLRDKEVERDLRVTISIIVGDGNHDQKIVIDLTNDSNPVFLFTVFITKTDFDILRKDQGINVGFNDFPTALVNLLDKCTEAISLGGNGTFKLMLDDYCGTVSGGCLMNMKRFKIKILEENPFKNLCHLTLDVSRGSDIQIQQKLEMELCKTRQCLSQESKLHEESLNKITELVEDIKEKNKSIDNLNMLIDNMKTEREEECRRDQLQFQSKEKQLKEDYEKKIFEEQEQFIKKFDKSQTKIQALEEEINRINEKQREMASQILEREKEIEKNKYDLSVAKEEVSTLKNQNQKLDADYHDKEKTVNILRTRLAVAEQELKDNNILLLNHQKKLEESSKEKVDLQRNLDFITNKLEKKESVVLNLSEELMKGNEIISKQQAKISVIIAKLNDCNELMLEKGKLVEEKENVLQKNYELNSKLQDQLAEANKQLISDNDKIKFLEIEVKEKTKKLDDTLKSVTVLKKIVQKNFDGLQSDTCQKSLLFYRPFLSMPSLLPSDDNRRLMELNYSLLNDLHSNLINSQSKTVSNIIEPYIKRYSKRFNFIPPSLFRSSEVPLAALLSYDGSNVPVSSSTNADGQYMYHCPLKSSRSDPFISSKENLMKNVNDYQAFTMPTQPLPFLSRVVSDSSLPSSCENIIKSQPQIIPTYSSRGHNSEGKVKKFCDEKGECVPPYAPVGAFRLRPTIRQNNFTTSSGRGFANIKSNKVENPCLTKPFVRKTPAITAPPLTQEQKEAKELALMSKRSQCPKTRGNQNTKAQATQIPDPLYLCGSTPPEIRGLHILMQKPSPQGCFKIKAKDAPTIQHTQNASKNMQKEPEPSAYFS